jgi:hypothetical protein
LSAKSNTRESLQTVQPANSRLKYVRAAGFCANRPASLDEE